MWMSSIFECCCNVFDVVQWAIDLVKTQAAALRGDTPDDEFIAKFILVKDPNRFVDDIVLLGDL